MKILIRKIFLFLLVPLLFILFIELFLPLSTFTFRGYEALLFNNEIPHLGHFYPNQDIEVKAEGDLCHHSNFAIKKNEKWITDKIGFRNNYFIPKADVVFLGNSFIYGTGLAQQDIISNQLITKFKNRLKVYNMAPSTMGEFDYYLRNRIIKKPKYIILGLGEMSVSGGYVPFDHGKDSYVKEILKKLFYSGFNTVVDRSTRFYSIKWVKARMKKLINIGVRGEMNNKMFFGQGKNPKELNAKELEESINGIVSCKKYCDSLNIKFIFIPTPNKETIYFDYVRIGKQSNYISKLIDGLKQYNVNCINTVELFNQYRMYNNELLYHLDDTHWNAVGISLVVNKLKDFIVIQ